MQLRLPCEGGLTGKTYVTERLWVKASLSQCPVHGRGGCGFARHTAYARVEPPGAKVARYYCPTARRTWSLLPDCLASRLSSTVQEVEVVMLRVESAPSIESAAGALRPDVTLPSAVRWVRRRVAAMRAFLRALVTLSPSLFGCAPTLTSVRAALGVVSLRAVAGAQLGAMPPPLGLGPRCRSP